MAGYPSEDNRFVNREADGCQDDADDNEKEQGVDAHAGPIERRVLCFVLPESRRCILIFRMLPVRQPRKVCGEWMEVKKLMECLVISVPSGQIRERRVGGSLSWGVEPSDHYVRGLNGGWIIGDGVRSQIRVIEIIPVWSADIITPRVTCGEPLPPQATHQTFA
jgi:hypothetical protein